MTTTLWQNDCQVPATNGTAVTTANTGTGTNALNGGANNALGSQSTGAGNTVIVDTSLKPGALTQSWKLTQASTVVNNQFPPAFTAQSDITIDGAFYCPSTPAATTTILRLFSDAAFATNAMSVNYTTTRKIQIQETGQTAVSSTPVLTASTWYYFKFRYQQSTNTATLTFYPYGSVSVTASCTTPVVGSYTIQSSRLGISTASSGFGQMNVAALRISGGGDPARQDVTNQVPVADAGPDQTADPYDVVTLDGSRSFDLDGTVASYAWTQTSGGAVSLSSTSSVAPTFTAPALLAGDTLVFSLTATDNNGASSTADTCTVTVLPHTTFRLDAAGATTAVRVLRL